jgi:hypothetical protein
MRLRRFASLVGLAGVLDRGRSVVLGYLACRTPNPFQGPSMVGSGYFS